MQPDFYQHESEFNLKHRSPQTIQSSSDATKASVPLRAERRATPLLANVGLQTLRGTVRLRA